VGLAAGFAAAKIGAAQNPQYVVPAGFCSPHAWQAAISSPSLGCLKVNMMRADRRASARRTSYGAAAAG
jgi:hypothetical protein